MIILMNNIISIYDLSMTYHTKIRRGLLKSESTRIDALKNINLNIEEGTIFGLLGPNGAGKTTLIKCLTTLLIPTQGTARINGYDIRKQEKQIRASIGAMLMGERGLYWKLTARENFEYFARLYSIPKDLRAARVEYVINLLELEDLVDRPVESYSSGQKMKAAFAKALIHDPPILFLDEPTIAMDVHGSRKLKKVVKSLPNEGKTVIYTTHIMKEAHELCDRLAIIDKGRIIADDTPKNLIKISDIDHVLSLSGSFNEGHKKKVEELSLVNTVGLIQESSGLSKLEIIVEDNMQALPKITQLLVQEGAVIETIAQKEPTLEDVFINLTGRSLKEDTKVGI